MSSGAGGFGSVQLASSAQSVPRMRFLIFIKILSWGFGLARYLAAGQPTSSVV